MAAAGIKSPFIPASEGDFDSFVRQFVSRITQNPSLYDVTPERATLLESQLVNWDANYAAAVAARDAAKAAVVSKDEARATLEETVRSVARLIQANDTISDAARTAAGLPVHKTTRTPVPVPHTFPTITVVGSDRLELTVMYSDVSTPTRKGRPAGVRGCEVYCSVAETPPASPEDYRFVAFSTRTPEVVTFRSEEGSGTANFLLRWVNTKGEAGPWSQVASATIPAV
ncbi:MAG: hypothetical protein R3C49_25020 [Planctomycetaceae bacterium]